MAGPIERQRRRGVSDFESAADEQQRFGGEQGGARRAGFGLALHGGERDQRAEDTAEDTGRVIAVPPEHQTGVAQLDETGQDRRARQHEITLARLGASVPDRFEQRLSLLDQAQRSLVVLGAQNLHRQLQGSR